MMTCFFEASDNGESYTTKHVYLCVYVCMINIKAMDDLDEILETYIFQALRSLLT